MCRNERWPASCFPRHFYEFFILRPRREQPSARTPRCYSGGYSLKNIMTFGLIACRHWYSGSVFLANSRVR